MAKDFCSTATRTRKLELNFFHSNITLYSEVVPNPLSEGATMLYVLDVSTLTHLIGMKMGLLGVCRTWRPTAEQGNS